MRNFLCNRSDPPSKKNLNSKKEIKTNIFIWTIPPKKCGPPSKKLYYDFQKRRKSKCFYPHRLRDSVSPVCGIFCCCLQKVTRREYFITYILWDVNIYGNIIMITRIYYTCPLDLWYIVSHKINHFLTSKKKVFKYFLSSRVRKTIFILCLAVNKLFAFSFHLIPLTPKELQTIWQRKIKEINIYIYTVLYPQSKCACLI